MGWNGTDQGPVRLLKARKHKRAYFQFKRIGAHLRTAGDERSPCAKWVGLSGGLNDQNIQNDWIICCLDKNGGHSALKSPPRTKRLKCEWIYFNVIWTNTKCFFFLKTFGNKLCSGNFEDSYLRNGSCSGSRASVVAGSGNTLSQSQPHFLSFLVKHTI